MKLPLAYYGDPILRKKTEQVKEINDDIRKFIQDMIETLEAEDGIGLAAPQVHRPLAIFLVRAPIFEPDGRSWKPGTLRIFINPKILSYSDQQSGEPTKLAYRFLDCRRMSHARYRSPLKRATC